MMLIWQSARVWAIACLVASCTEGAGTAPPAAVDADGDGFAVEVDCDDGAASVHPGALEHCDGVDENCDGAADEGAVDAALWYADADGDGHGDPASGIRSCAPPIDHVAAAGDCADDLGSVHPGADEVCNGVDDDCDGLVDDDASDVSSWFVDRDGDGYGDDATTVTACTEPLGTAPVAGDCDDHQDDTHPAALERCNGVDDDCDGSVDVDAADARTFYRDSDGDGHGDPAATATACAPPSGFVAAGDDCDDTVAEIFPGQIELCDGVDEDCDGQADEDAGDVGRWYVDGDGDGFGWAAVWVESCDPVSGHVANSGDCDDWNAANHPGAPERCDGVDNNCDLSVDGPDAVDPLTWFADADGDGVGSALAPARACWAPSGHVALPGDCDDGDPLVSPFHAEICDDGIDNDCAGGVDDCPPPPGPLSGADADAVWWGADRTDVGTQLAVFDHDGDGRDDIAVGGPHTTNGTSWSGSVWLIYGAAAPPASDALEVVADARLDNEADQARLGTFLTGAADLDGDGFQDLVVAGHEANVGGTSDKGAVYVLYGDPVRRAGTALVASTAALVEGGGGHTMGHGVAALGDIDGDGLDDVAFAAPRRTDGSQEGAVYLLLGAPTELPPVTSYASLPRIQGAADDQLCFERCIAGGDFDGDGLGDVLTASRYGSSAAAYLLYGAAGAPAPVVIADTLPAFAESAPSFGWGEVVAAIGDWSGDGYEDLALSDWGSSVFGGGGAVSVFFGGAARYAGTTPTSAADLALTGLGPGGFGWAVTPLGDVDADGTDDLAIGIPFADAVQTGAGAVLAYAGGPTGRLDSSDSTWMFFGDYGNSEFGTAIAVGDFDGDSAVDLVVGAPNAGLEAGRVYLFLAPFL